MGAVAVVAWLASAGCVAAGVALHLLRPAGGPAALRGTVLQVRAQGDRTSCLVIGLSHDRGRRPAAVVRVAVRSVALREGQRVDVALAGGDRVRLSLRPGARGFVLSKPVLAYAGAGQLAALGLLALLLRF
jgi:hypothetical protein